MEPRLAQARMARYIFVQFYKSVHHPDFAMRTDEETRANYRNSEAARMEIAIFLAWVRGQNELSPQEQEKVSRLAEKYQRGRGRYNHEVIEHIL